MFHNLTTSFSHWQVSILVLDDILSSIFTYRNEAQNFLSGRNYAPSYYWGLTWKLESLICLHNLWLLWPWVHLSSHPVHLLWGGLRHLFHEIETHEQILWICQWLWCLCHDYLDILVTRSLQWHNHMSLRLIFIFMFIKLIYTQHCKSGIELSYFLPSFLLSGDSFQFFSFFECLVRF